MTADLRPDLIEAMAKAGYEAMLTRIDPALDFEKHSWDNQTGILREDWRTTTKAMLKAMLTLCYTGGHTNDR